MKRGQAFLELETPDRDVEFPKDSKKDPKDSKEDSILSSSIEIMGQEFGWSGGGLGRPWEKDLKIPELRGFQYSLIFCGVEEGGYQ